MLVSKTRARFSTVLLLLMLIGVFAVRPQISQAQDPTSCNGSSACHKATGPIGDNSCNGDYACLYTTGSISDNSCNGFRACAWSTSPISANSCNGSTACLNTTGSISANSCNSDQACNDADGPIGVNSCHGYAACFFTSFSIGDNSCHGDQACRYSTGPIGDCMNNTVPVAACLTPEAALNDLAELIASMNLHQGIHNSLDAKIAAASQALADLNANNDAAAVNILNAFINSVEAQRGKKLTGEQADDLIAAAQAVITLIND